MALLDNGVTLVSFMLESLLYGIYVFLFMGTFAFLTWYRSTKLIDYPSILVILLPWLMCTVHISLIFDNRIYTLLKAPSNLHVTTKELFVADVLSVVVGFAAQLIFIYRSWVLYDHNRNVPVFPVLVSIAAFGCAMAAQSHVSATEPRARSLPAQAASLERTARILSFCLNVAVTGLILVKVYRHIRRDPDRRFSSPIDYLRAFAGACVESGVLLLAAHLLVLLLSELRHPLQDIATCAAVQLYGIAPTLMIMRLAMRLWSFESTNWSTLMTSSLEFTGQLTTLWTVGAISNSTEVGMDTKPYQKTDSADLIPA